MQEWNQYNESGNRHGYWEEYFLTTGLIETKGVYNDGLKHGYWEEFWANGNISYRETYKNGIRHGEQISFWSNGQIESHGVYINGEKCGYWKYTTSRHTTIEYELFFARM